VLARLHCARAYAVHQLLEDVDRTTASVAAALEPVYGIVLALVRLGEIPYWRTLIGAVPTRCCFIQHGREVQQR
jgi:hypothetical protein